MTEQPIKMRRELGLLSGIAIILGIIFGTGIFISPREVIEKAGSVWAALLVWLVCGILATLGALSYAELGTALAKSGGDYHYIHESYGPLPAFLYLWDAVIIFVTQMCFLFNVAAAYQHLELGPNVPELDPNSKRNKILLVLIFSLDIFIHFRPSTNAIMALTFANNILKPFFPNCAVDRYCKKIVAGLTISFVTFINAYNVKLTTKIQNVFMFTKIASLSLIIIGGIAWASQGNLQYFEDGWAGTQASVGDWSIAFYTGIFAYTGWNYLNFMTEELRNPYKNLPRAIYVSLPTVTILYILANFAYLAVLGPIGVKSSDAIAVDFAVIAMSYLKWAMPIIVASACLGGLCIHVMTSSRMCYAGARNGHMPELLAHINLKCLTPMPSLVFLAILSLIMLIPDSLTTLITYCSFVESFFTTLSCSAVLWLRYKRPELPRPIKVQLWIPITFVTVTTLLMIAPVMSEPVAVLSGILITLTGVPIYWIFIKKQPKIAALCSKHFTVFCQKLFFTVMEDKTE